MGDLISDEDLESIVRAGIDDVFFTTRFVDDGRYNKKEMSTTNKYYGQLNY